jgi:hypothetical protein
MRRPFAWVVGGMAALGLVRRRHEPSPAAPDPRAEELRRKLDESRSIVEEREEFEAAELPIDRAEPAPEGPASRRRAVHEAGRSTVERMRGEVDS